MPIDRFQYHAFSTGLGGHITQPFDEIIPVQAASALPESGGFGSTHVENFRFRDIISFASATAVVAGSYSQRNHTWDALAMVTIDGLNILSTLTADRVVARISSTHPDDPSQPACITARGSYFENLRIAGYPVDVSVDTGLLDNYCTFPKLSDAFQKNDDGIRDLFPRSDPARHGVMGCSLLPELENLEDDHPLRVWRKDRGIFLVPGFGLIRLAQFRITPYARRLTMFQLEFGSTPAGNVSGGGAEGNGSPWVP